MYAMSIIDWTDDGRRARVVPEVSMTRRFVDRAEVAMSINGEPRRLAVPVWATLLDVLRDELALTGAKRACDRGACGACTVLVDDRRIYACLALAAMQDGRCVVTIEGLARGGELHPVQRAFVAHDALQCGYCTPGQILSAVGLLREGRATDEDSLREQMSGNLCRCGAYPGIIAAIRDAAGG
jgi:xanthine dehydrogenase YagT iron-sulfur-binding subunit